MNANFIREKAIEILGDILMVGAGLVAGYYAKVIFTTLFM